MEFAPPLELEDQPLPLPDELLVIRNPVSANSQRAQHQITSLQQRFPFSAVDVYPTLYDATAAPEENRLANQQRVLNLLQERVDANDPHPSHPRLWLVAATGDGTIRDIYEALLNADDAIRAVPVLPLAGGNGNDNSSMAHGFWSKRWPAQRLHRAHIEPVQLLECSITLPDGTVEVRHASGYGSFGDITAKTAKSIDQDRGHNRVVQLVNEKILAMRSVAKASSMVIVERGVKRDTFDLIFANGSRMAKFLHWPQKLSEPQFMRTELHSKNPLSLAVAGTRLALGRQPSTAVPDGNMVRFQVASDTWMQLDGEAFPLVANSSVAIRRTQRSVNVVHLK